MKGTTFDALCGILGKPTVDIDYGWRWETPGRPFASLSKQPQDGRVFTLVATSRPDFAKLREAGDRPNSACLPSGYGADVALLEMRVRDIASLARVVAWVDRAPPFAPSGRKR